MMYTDYDWISVRVFRGAGEEKESRIKGKGVEGEGSNTGGTKFLQHIP